jgi:hypothetical protein
MTLLRPPESPLIDARTPAAGTENGCRRDKPSEPARPELQGWAVRSGAIGFFVTVVVVTGVVAANGGGLASIGAGIMVAGFDGLPFGAMLGVMTYYMRYPDDS